MKLDVLAAGEIYVDLIMSGSGPLPRPGEEWIAQEFTREPGGGAVITALALARLGERVGIAGAVGADDSDWLRTQLARAGIDVSGVLSLDGARTGTTVAISNGSDRSFFTHVGANREAKAAIAASTAASRHLHWAAPADVALLEIFRAQGMSISLDVGYPHADARCLAALPLVDIFLPNELEASRLTGESEPEGMLAALHRAGAREVALKLGARGAAMIINGRFVHTEPPSVQTIDTTGAGDCFNAGFLHAWLRGDPPELCLRMGNVCGAFSTRALGGIAGFPTPEEIACLMK